MSTYIISDIHGCFAEFKQLLKKIKFSVEDELFILGDCLDRGPEPIPLIKYIMTQPNIYMIKGNHEIMAMNIIKNYLNLEITEESLDALLNEEATLAYADWMNNGGGITLKQFSALPKEEREDIMLYLEETYNYEMLEVNNKLYILVHAGLNNFSPNKELEEYSLHDILWTRPDYTKRYYPGNRIFLVTGHTPTTYIRKDKESLVYEGNGHIAIDCGCCFGCKLAAYCLETGEVTYVNKE